jgi:VirK protein
VKAAVLLSAALGCGITRASVDELLPSPNYTSVIEALQGTRLVRLTTDLDECTYEDTGKPGPSLRSGIYVNAYIIVPNRGLYFSDVHQTLDETDQPVTEYVRYRLTVDGQLKLARIRAAGSVAVRQDTIVCGVPRGARFTW